MQIVAPEEVRFDGLTFSPDGNFVYYTMYGRLGGVASRYRISVLGGTSQKLIEDIDSRVSFSRDASQFLPAGFRVSGRFDTGRRRVERKGTTVRIRNLALTGGTPTLLPMPVTGVARWSPDGNGIAYPDFRNGLSNIFHRTNDGKERQVTRFTSENIYLFGRQTESASRFRAARVRPTSSC